jgi:hypothetical protein
VEADQYYEPEDPEVSSIRYETDLVPFKLRTDVVVVGRAYAPGGTAVASLKAAVAVGPHRKEVLVTGDRVCEFREGAPPRFSAPAPFTSMGIRYERAYGGTDLHSLPGIPFTYPRNPVGCGFAIRNIRENVDGLRLPNVEDPADPLTPERLIPGDVKLWNRQPLPQGLGWFHRAWYPRCSFLAAMPAFVPVDEVMREEALGLVPRGQAALAASFRLPSKDARFYNGASLGLAVPYLAGGEAVQLENLTASGRLSFLLPAAGPSISLDLGEGEQPLTTVLHSVTIRVEENEIDMVWRGAQTYPGVEWLPKMTALRARVE